MATRKALVNVNGNISELPIGDTLEGAGSGGLNTYTNNVVLDFGSSENDIAIATITNSVITNANIKGFNFLWQASANHETYEDYKLEDLKLSIENIIDNTSFQVVAFAPNNTWGVYNFKVLINY